MARLNDAAAAAVDPVELLRRKYSRQNKEIARVNSTQCVRIRNLENEVSRLLAENLGLREETLRLRSEVESRGAQKVAEHVAVAKSNLEAKLLELTTLVTLLGVEPNPSRRLSAKEVEVSQDCPTQIPDRRNWKNMCTLSEAAGLHDGRLPPILEDKSYPRLTLEPTEILNILSDPMTENTESPDIGPPPVSKFINEDPVKIDLLSQVGTETEEPTGIDPSQSVNLEQRRKRRDSAAPSERKRHSRFEPNPNKSVKEVAQSLKTGAKRKLSSRDEEDEVSGRKVIEAPPEDFTYWTRTVGDQPQRKTEVEIDIAGNNLPKDFVVARARPRDRPSSTVQTNERKALGPKSTNTDVMKSPKKAATATMADDITIKKGIPLCRDQARERGQEGRLEVVAQQLTAEPMVVAVDVKGEPERPANHHIHPLLEHGPAAANLESRDTPTPSDPGPGNDGHRQSRRNKGSVSYTEPNLRDKMRRPTKELVDAVRGEGKAQRLSIVELEQEPIATGPEIKQEVETGDHWKSIPPASLSDVCSKSPLGKGAAARQETAPAQRQRRRSSIHPSVQNGISGSDSGPATTSVLLVHSRKASQGNDRRSVQNNSSFDEAMARLDRFQFTGSSPGERNDSKTPICQVEGQVFKTARESSVIYEPGQAMMHDESSSRKSNERFLSTSSQWMTGPGASGPEKETDHQKSGQGMRRSNNHLASSKGAERTSRSERVSARRRSMLL